MRTINTKSDYTLPNTCLTIVTFTSVLLMMAPVFAHQCRYLKGDKKNLCLAKQENQRFYCRYVKDIDQRNYCTSHFVLDKKLCEGIKGEDLKGQCNQEMDNRLKELADEEARRAEEAEQAKAAQDNKANGKNP